MLKKFLPRISGPPLTRRRDSPLFFPCPLSRTSRYFFDPSVFLLRASDHSLPSGNLYPWSSTYSVSFPPRLLRLSTPLFSCRRVQPPRLLLRVRKKLLPPFRPEPSPLRRFSLGMPAGALTLFLQRLDFRLLSQIPPLPFL